MKARILKVLGDVDMMLNAVETEYVIGLVGVQVRTVARVSFMAHMEEIVVLMKVETQKELEDVEVMVIVKEHVIVLRTSVVKDAVDALEDKVLPYQTLVNHQVHQLARGLLLLLHLSRGHQLQLSLVHLILFLIILMPWGHIPRFMIAANFLMSRMWGHLLLLQLSNQTPGLLLGQLQGRIQRLYRPPTRCLLRLCQTVLFLLHQPLPPTILLLRLSYHFHRPRLPRIVQFTNLQTPSAHTNAHMIQTATASAYAAPQPLDAAA